jgi:hypothetical protein
MIEDVLRDAGFPKALAANFVSAGKGALRSESGPLETPAPSPDAQASMAALLAGLELLRSPTWTRNFRSFSPSSTPATRS